MALDNNTVSISDALRIAKQYYSEKGYNHALRVMQYVADNEMIPNEYRHDCLTLAIMHDLIEDTNYTGSGLPENFKKALELLTKRPDEDYIEYIKNIRDTEYKNWRMCAWWVKLADMKDHLSQTDTLTEKLKEKYVKALAFLL